MQLELGFSVLPGRPSRTRPYRTSRRERARVNAKRAAIKAAGGVAYEELLEYERQARAKYRERHPDYWRDYEKKNGVPFKTALCAAARVRGRKRGLESTIKPDDLIWPTHCPVLGIKLDYPERTGQRGTFGARANYPTLDRWDSTKGYVKGNVFVISFRANTLKNNGTADELKKVAEYTARKPWHG